MYLHNGTKGAGVFVYLWAVSLVAMAVGILRLKERSASRVLEVVLACILGINFGVGSILAGALHIFYGPETARMIGWAPGSPFQYEVGVADVALGLVCFLCLFIRGNFWLAAIIAQCTFLFGCMAGHFMNQRTHGNVAEYNIGLKIVVGDFLLPLIVIALYVVYRRLHRPVS